MGGREIPVLMFGLVSSVLVVAVGGLGDSGVPADGGASSDARGSVETQSLHEQVRGVSNYGYEVGAPGNQNVVYWEHLFDEPDADELEYRALLDSLSPGVRASYDGVWMLRRDTFARAQERRAAEQERAEAEYAVFIEEHLRRLRGEAELSEPVPVGAPARGGGTTSSQDDGESAQVAKRWNETYRRVLTTPQSMIGGYAATDDALGEFMGRAGPVPSDVSEAWKTVMRLKSEDWDVETCLRYQRAQFVICEHERATGCQERLDRELSNCEACATDGGCGSR